MKKFFSLVLALAMALSMASFASAEETTTIHIGVIGPMTGAAAVYGLAVARGAEIAVEEINAAGKVNIVLDVQDDENDAGRSPSSTTTPTPIPPVSIRPLRARLPSWG